MNQPGRKKVIGSANFLSSCSMMVCCESRFERLACAPIVDRYTTLLGRDTSSAELKAAAVVIASENQATGRS